MPFVEIDKVSLIENIIPGFDVRFIHASSMTIARWKISAGSVLPEHSHHNEQVSSVLSGEFEFTVSGETRTLDSGMIGIVPPNAIHSGRAITDCEIMDVFYPVREDYQAISSRL